MTTEQSPQLSEPPWMTFCRRHIGLHERPGPESEPLIAEAFALCHVDPKTHDDSTTAWCAAWVGLCLERSGYPSTRRANARSYLDYGIPLLRPKAGCIIVFSRPPHPADGHVGFMVEVPTALASNVLVMSGNQHNQVCIAPYPVSRILGWRWPEPRE